MTLGVYAVEQREHASTHFYTYTLDKPGVTSVAFSFLPGETANNTLNNYPRIDNLVVGGAVPEPTSWVMMIAGFGLVGVARRARKPLTVVT